MSPTRLLTTIGGALGAALLIYVVIVLGFQKKKETASSQPAANAEHNHSHDPQLHALEQKAENGTAADKMELVEYMIAKSVEDGHLLQHAASVLESVVADYPNYALGLRTLGNIYYDLGMVKQAEPTYRRYLELHPNDANYLTDYGTVILANGRPEEAVEAYKKAIELYPDHYHASFNLSIAYKRMNDTKNSNLYRKRAEDIDARVGKVLAPEIMVPDLPQGVASTPQAEAAGNLGRYAALQQFFRTHEIVGPKMAGFKVEQDVAILFVSQFPMANMPPFARKAFDQKINAQMAKIEGASARLDIRDLDSQSVLASYQK